MSVLSPGQHDCVTVINNFFSRKRLDYYTKPQGLEKEPKLPPKLAGPLHKIIMSTNLNPVKVVINEIYALIHIHHDLALDLIMLRKPFYVELCTSFSLLKAVFALVDVTAKVLS